jgi:two-component system sensor histidine kinase AtoS
VGTESKANSTFPPAEALVDALRARVTQNVVEALAAVAPEEALRDRVSAAVHEALQEHARALEDRLLRVERLASAGQLSAGVAHELRNPLAVIETSLFILNERMGSDERAQRQLRRIGEQVAVATAIVNDLLETVRNRPISRAPVDLAAVARDALGRVPRPSNITVALDLAPGVAVVEGDARRLTQVAVNLLSNAVQSLSEASVPAPRLALSVARDGDEATLSVVDNGPGIPLDALPRLFDPLFSTRPEGTGLGLALSRRIVEAHGGALTAANGANGGARFTLRMRLRGV